MLLTNTIDEEMCGGVKGSVCISVHSCSSTCKAHSASEEFMVRYAWEMLAPTQIGCGLAP